MSDTWPVLQPTLNNLVNHRSSLGRVDYSHVVIIRSLSSEHSRIAYIQRARHAMKNSWQYSTINVGFVYFVVRHLSRHVPRCLSSHSNISCVLLRWAGATMLVQMGRCVPPLVDVVPGCLCYQTGAGRPLHWCVGWSVTWKLEVIQLRWWGWLRCCSAWLYDHVIRCSFVRHARAAPETAHGARSQVCFRRVTWSSPERKYDGNTRIRNHWKRKRGEINMCLPIK